MELKELRKIVKSGESSKIQFKASINSADQLAAEIVAFSNAKGGILLIGISDSGKLIGIDNNDLNKINQLISNTATNNIFAPVFPITENVEIADNKFVIVVHIFEGAHKPYCDRNRIYWIKNGADKRKSLPEDIHQLMNNTRKISPLELNIRKSYIDNFNLKKYKEFYEIEYGEILSEKKSELFRIFNNKQLFLKEELTLLGGLTFGKNKAFTTPSFCLKAVNFIGNDTSVMEYRDSEDYYGPIDYLFKSGMNFILRNLHKIQNSKSINSQGDLEISKIVFEELLVNALIHKDYSYETPVKIFIFDNRIEIINDGCFLEGISVDLAKKGCAKPRNSILLYYASKLLSYRGLGKGIRRAYEAYNAIEIINDADLNQVKCIIKRREQSVAPATKDATQHATQHTTKDATQDATFEKKINLNNTHLNILKLCKKEYNRKDIAQKINLKESYVRRKLLPFLIKNKLLNYTDTDSLKSINQKYIITEKGLNFLPQRARRAAEKNE